MNMEDIRITIAFLLDALLLMFVTLSAVLVMFAVYPPSVVLSVSGFISWERTVRRNAELLNSPHSWERVSAKLFAAMLDHRLIVGLIGFVGLVLSAVIFLKGR